jgi:flavin reductase (DIM6/NTAB) family NADH-FMN oxidoreductase RutF
MASGKEVAKVDERLVNLGDEMKIDPSQLDWKDAHELLVGAILPRPIAFVSTVGEDGVNNVAPFSFYAPISVKPAYIGISFSRYRDGRKKDTLVNIEFSKDFVINVVTEELAEAMNQASKDYPSYVDEFKEVGLTPVKSDLVKSPMVAESPVKMECRLVQTLEFGEVPRITNFVIGEVLRVHIKEDLWLDNTIKAYKLKAIGRLGEEFYCRITDLFEMRRSSNL